MSEELQPIKINKFIDTKPMIGNLETDSFLILMGSLAIAGLFIQDFLHQMLFVIFGVFLTKLHVKAKDKLVRGFFKHILYSFGIVKTKKNIPFYQRYFIGA